MHTIERKVKLHTKRTNLHNKGRNVILEAFKNVMSMISLLLNDSIKSLWWLTVSSLNEVVLQGVREREESALSCSSCQRLECRQTKPLRILSPRCYGNKIKIKERR